MKQSFRISFVGFFLFFYFLLPLVLFKRFILYCTEIILFGSKSSSQITTFNNFKTELILRAQ